MEILDEKRFRIYKKDEEVWVYDAYSNEEYKLDDDEEEYDDDENYEDED